MNKKKKKDSNILIIIGIIVFATIVSILATLLNPADKTEETILQQEGYNTTEEDAFYKKIVTNNTLDDYYNDLTNKRDSAYEEYYFAKESYEFIELKMSYNNTVNKVLNITSNLRNNKVEYTYEISYKSTQLLIEGNSDDNYDCNIIVQKNISDDDITNVCSEVPDEISTFLERRDKLLSNKKIKELLDQPIKQYVEE